MIELPGIHKKALVIRLRKLESSDEWNPHTGSGIMEFHISRGARDTYGFEDSLFRKSGNVIFPDFTAGRKFAQQLKDKNARAGHINAMGLMDEILHHVTALYREQKKPEVFSHAVQFLEEKLDTDTVDEALRFFAREFPPQQVYNGELSIDAYMRDETDGIPHRHLLLEEMIMLWLTNANPAVETYKKILFDDTKLIKNTAYKKMIRHLGKFFKTQPLFGPEKQNLLDMLRAPASAAPGSIKEQLVYIREHWGLYLENFMSRLLTALDLIKEEEKFGGFGPGETPVLDFSGESFAQDYESFSSDYAWMPNLVLIAKSTHVWLDQLSKKYQRHIARLDQIPDEELNQLATRGFTGLWLIGLWERSRASREIKKMCGNPEAMASAYSIYDYRTAAELGGDDAVYNLKHRAAQRGIRLAGDMVPNHMGIDSPWVVEHPDWFLSLDYCPFPSYSFNGPNLSSDDRVSIFLEDHYYDRTDAAVVFKWVDNRTGSVRYVYHGNDGTTMPWNDTAQLNYLNAEVREAVTRTIFSVADKFPVIRFDAAMTLTKQHYQRLWFPEPGAGGDIPTRAGKGLSRADFNQHMPDEFWRQVVDRFASAQSDTLLLAEAFWLMEAYFVRTLGMHRVYNSAFMNFLKNEDNAQFRTSIKNVLQFNPEILKRFVNFMNNPDEETAVTQFGKGDKYFGVCMLMATLPGLPMFGHGQVEGFAEKYGMEFKHAYWDETPDQDLVRRHENEIFPLLRKRYLFAEVENFSLYDFYTPEGWVNEDVIAYSNRGGEERSLVVYHNKYAETAGWIKTSVRQKNLGEALGLTKEDNHYTIFRDFASGLEYIRASRELFEKGLYVELSAYKKNVFLDFREILDDETGAYAQLADMLQGKGVHSLEDTRRRHFLNPLLKPFQELLDPGPVRQLEKGDADAAEVLEKKFHLFLQAVLHLTNGNGDPVETTRQWRVKLDRLTALTTPSLSPAAGYLPEPPVALRFIKPVFFTWMVVRQTAELMAVDNRSTTTPTVIAAGVGTWGFLENWLLTEKIVELFRQLGAAEDETSKLFRLLKVLTIYGAQWADESFFRDENVRVLLGVNEHQGTLWFHKESAEELVYWLSLASLVDIEDIETSSLTPAVEESVTRRVNIIQRLRRAMEQSGYRFEQLLLDIPKIFG